MLKAYRLFCVASIYVRIIRNHLCEAVKIEIFWNEKYMIYATFVITGAYMNVAAISNAVSLHAWLDNDRKGLYAAFSFHSHILSTYRVTYDSCILSLYLNVCSCPRNSNEPFPSLCVFVVTSVVDIVGSEASSYKPKWTRATVDPRDIVAIVRCSLFVRWRATTTVVRS